MIAAITMVDVEIIVAATMAARAMGRVFTAAVITDAAITAAMAMAAGTTATGAFMAIGDIMADPMAEERIRDVESDMAATPEVDFARACCRKL